MYSLESCPYKLSKDITDFLRIFAQREHYKLQIADSIIWYHANTHMHTHTYAHTHTQSHTQTHTQHTHAHTHTHTCMHTHIFISFVFYTTWIIIYYYYYEEC